MTKDGSKSGAVTIVLTNAAGEQVSQVLLGPGGTMRFAFGEPSRRSGVWRVWANKTSSDVYAAGRSIAGVEKFSLHESGDWRHQWVTTAQAERFTGSPNRIIDQWRQPAEQGGGMTKALVIRVPFEDVVDVPPGDSIEKKVDWLPAAREPGYAASVHVVVARTDQGDVPMHGGVPVDGFTLADGRVVLLVVSHPQIPEAEAAKIAVVRRFAIERSMGMNMSTATVPRIAVHGYDTEGTRVVWDLAFPRSEPAAGAPPFVNPAHLAFDSDELPGN